MLNKQALERSKALHQHRRAAVQVGVWALALGFFVALGGKADFVGVTLAIWLVGTVEAFCKGLELCQLCRGLAATDRFAGYIFGLHYRLVTLALEQSPGGISVPVFCSCVSPVNN